MPASGKAARDRGRCSRQEGIHAGGARAPAVAGRRVPALPTETGTGAASALAGRAGPLPSGSRIPAKPGGGASPAERAWRCKPSRPAAWPAAFCAPQRNAFAGMPAAMDTEGEATSRKRQAKPVQRRQSARRIGRCCRLDAAKRPASRSMVRGEYSLMRTIRWRDRHCPPEGVKLFLNSAVSPRPEGDFPSRGDEPSCRIPPA